MRKVIFNPYNEEFECKVCRCWFKPSLFGFDYCSKKCMEKADRERLTELKEVDNED